jgi:molecular chaperone GrpE
MPDKDRRARGRIPVRFAGEGETPGKDAGGETGESGGAGELTPEEIGRASIYEDETEVMRRINRGGEGDAPGERERADDSDVAGTINPAEMPESRGDQDTRPPLAGEEAKREDDEAAGSSGEAPLRADAAGPEVAELIATRAELRRVEGELARLKGEWDELNDKFMRRQADFDNFRRRTERERVETYQRALGEVVSRLLPVLDNLQRALDAEKVIEGGESDEFRHFLHGVELINKQFGGLLENLGVEAVPTVGHPFDPHVHEAVAAEQSEEFEPETVMEEMQRGYRLGDKLLRPAMVKVAKS